MGNRYVFSENLTEIKQKGVVVKEMAVLYNPLGKIIFQAKWKNDTKLVDISDAVKYFQYSRGVLNPFATITIHYLRPHDFINFTSKNMQNVDEKFDITIQFHYGLQQKTYNLLDLRIQERRNVKSTTALKTDQLEIHDFLFPNQIDNLFTIVNGYYEKQKKLSDIFKDLVSQAGITISILDDFDNDTNVEYLFIPTTDFLTASLHLINHHQVYNSIYAYYLDVDGLVVTSINQSNKRSALLKILIDDANPQKDYASGFECIFTRGYFGLQSQYKIVNPSTYETKEDTKTYKQLLSQFAIDLGKKTVNGLYGFLHAYYYNNRLVYNPWFESTQQILIVQTTSLSDLNQIRPFSEIEVQASNNVSYLSGKWILLHQNIIFDFRKDTPYYFLQNILIRKP